MGRLLFAVLLSLLLANPALADASLQARRLDDTVRVGGLTSLLEPLPVPVAAQAQDDPAICGQVTADDFRLCRGLVDNNCGVVPADRYRLCEGVVRGDCGVAEAGNVRMCPAWQAAIRRLGS